MHWMSLVVDRTKETFVKFDMHWMSLVVDRTKETVVKFDMHWMCGNIFS
jgi:Ulp1 family protease